MANTYTLIASNTLSSSAASVTFSAIPNTFTDLVLKMSTRDTATTVIDRATRISFNSAGGTPYSQTELQGDGASATSQRVSFQATNIEFGRSTAASATSNTFANIELYIPNYAGSTNKPFSSFSVAETNGTTARIRAVALLFSNTNVISSLTLTADTAFIADSSFFLYGIKNS